MIKPFKQTALTLALLAAYAAHPGTAQANPLVAAAAGAPSGIALAVSTTETGAGEDAVTAEGAQAGASAEQFAGALQTVLVTTRRRVESSQNVPTPMTVLGEDALEGTRTYRVQDLQQLLPSTTINYVHARQLSFAVRGLGNNPASDGLEGSVGIYLDNVYLARPGRAAFDALDVQQLELLRGPQGTL
ncbi:MAG TPA: Plug domain-containing protein, partial [Pseudoduganella sp.]